MHLIPHKNTNNYILFSIIQILKFKTPSSYVSLIKDICNLVIGFEEKITDINTLYIRILSLRDKVKKIVIPDTVIEINAYAFSGYSNLKSIIVPNSITVINLNAFRGCVSLEEITIPDSVISIGTGAFYECKSLKKVKLSEKIISIKYECFFFCESLKEIDIPKSVEFVDSRSFYGCSSLKKVKILNRNVNIALSALPDDCEIIYIN